MRGHSSCSALSLGLVLLLSPPAAQGVDADASFRAGIEALAQEDLRQAEEHFARFVRARPNLAQGHFHLGLARARRAGALEALPSYEKAARIDPNLPGVQLALGTAYYELGRDDAATGALRRAVADDPRDASAHFFLGLVARRAGRRSEADRHFEFAARLEPEFANYAALARRRPRTREGKPWRISGSLGFEASDNVAVPELDANSGESDVAGIVEFGGRYRFVDQPKYQGEISYDFYQSLYESFSSANLQAHSLGLSGTRSFKAVDLDLKWRFDSSSRDGDKIVDANTIGPTLGYSWGPSSYSSATYQLVNKNFDAVADRDANAQVVSLDHFLFLDEGESHVSLGYEFTREAAEGPLFDYQAHGAGARYKMVFQALRQDWELELGYRFQVRDYTSATSAVDPGSAETRDRRQDDRHSFSLALEKTIADVVTLRMGYEHLSSNSNLRSADYSDNVFGMRVGAEY